MRQARGGQQGSGMADGRLTIDKDEEAGARVLRLSGDLSIQTIAEFEPALARQPAEGTLQLDMSGVRRLDTAGAWAIATQTARLEAAGGTLELSGADNRQQQLIETVTQALPKPPEETTRPRTFTDLLESLGRGTVSAGLFLAELAHILGLFLARLGRTAMQPRRLRLTALVAHCQDVGWRAIPIVSLMAFLIGVVLAYQGADQLRQFGAEIFVVDLLGVSILRELGPLLTAIIVAGRSGSAFTAQIGTMMVNQEVDAMQTLGLDPVDRLVLPRMIALVISLPLLSFYADVMGLIGGALMAWIELGIHPNTFLARMQEAVEVRHLAVGLVKAPVFAGVVALVGCFQGLRVTGSAESVGRLTTTAVVQSIFLVIIVDAAFSVAFARMGI